MQRCPACHHRFGADDCVCDLCGLSLESVASPVDAGFTNNLLTLASRLNSFVKRAPKVEVMAEAEREAEYVHIRR